MEMSGDIYSTLVRVLIQSLGVSEDGIRATARLRDDLGAESIDFLDIAFRLEREFRIRIPGDELFPESLFGGNREFLTDGRVTDEGMWLLRSRMPYADLGAVERDRQLDAISDLFTVELLVRYVAWKLAGRDRRHPESSLVAADRSRTIIPTTDDHH